MNFMNINVGDRGENPGEYSRREQLPYSDDYVYSRRSPENRNQHSMNKRVYDGYVTQEYDDHNVRYGNHQEYNVTRDNYDTYDRSGRHYEKNNRGERFTSKSRSRSRERDKSRYDRDHRDRYRERDHSRDSKGRREYSRDKRESPQDRRDSARNRRDDYRRRDNSRERLEKDDHRDEYRGRRSQDDYKSWKDDKSKFDLLPPSSTVIVQNLILDASERDIEDLLRRDGVSAPHSVAIIRERNGESRGFAFVEFEDVNTAENWIKITRREITIKGHTSTLNYSKSKRLPDIHADWICKVCNVLNFGSRARQGDKRCFKCQTSQSETNDLTKLNDSYASNELIKVEPCNVLMLRGMDFSTTEEVVRIEIVKLTTKAIYDVRLIKDKVTDMSRGFAFVELGNVEDAKELLETIEKMDPPFEIDHRRITVGYARHGYNAPLNGKKSVQNNQVSKQTAAENAVAQASSAKATAEYSQSMVDSYATAGTSSYQQDGKQQQDTNSADQQQQSNYTYDADSGYYYDASTGLYYDPNTGYYYNGTTQQWLYWNGTRYEVVNQDGTPVTKTDSSAQQQQQHQSAITQQKDDSETVPITGQKPKNARKIAKDMERWAKKLNNQSEARKFAVKQAQDELRMLEQKEEELRKKITLEKRITGALSQQIGTGAKDGVHSLFLPDYEDEPSSLQLGSALTPNKQQKPRGASLVTDLPEEDDDFVDESKFIDTVKIACLLCQRQFPSKENLMKHVQMSQLHTQNLEKHKQSKAS